MSVHVPARRPRLAGLGYALGMTVLAGCSSTQSEEPADQAEVIIRELLESSVIDQSRAGIEAALGRGATRSQLASQIDRQFDRGRIAGSTACLQKGLI